MTHQVQAASGYLRTVCDSPGVDGVWISKDCVTHQVKAASGYLRTVCDSSVVGGVWIS